MKTKTRIGLWWEVGEVVLFLVQWGVLIGGTAWIARSLGVW